MATLNSIMLAHLKSEYFILNLVIIASYVVWFRQRYMDTLVDIKAPTAAGDFQFATIHSSTFNQLERQIGLTLLVTSGARIYRSTSVSAGLATLLGFTQLFILITSAMADWVSAIYYLLAFGLVYLLLPEPSPTGPDSKVEVLNAASFKDLCQRENDSDAAYVVFLHTGWSSRCRHAYPLFSELSSRYATDKLRFATLDVGAWPHVARQLGVDLSTVSSQLPSVLLFENGQEVGRVPAAGAKTSNTVKYTFSKVDLIKALNLDARFAKTMAAGAGSSSS